MFSPQRKASLIHFSRGPRCRIKRQFSWGHLNLNRLDTNKRGGKILKDLEDGFGLECLIANPTQITKLSSTLIDVILTKRPDIFTEGGTYNPQIGDHCLIHDLINEKVTHYKPKTIPCRNLKNTDFELLTDDLSNAPAIAPSLGAVLNILNHCITECFQLLAYEVSNGGMNTCIQKGRQTSQRKLSPDFSTPITCQSKCGKVFEHLLCE